MIKWTCKDCGTVVSLKETIVPKSCCVCGGTTMESDAYNKKAEIRQQFEDDLVTVTTQLNDLYAAAEPLMEQYKKIIAYFKNLYLKKLITTEEYVEKTSLFKYKRTGGRPVASGKKDQDAEDIDVMADIEDIITNTTEMVA